MKKYTILVLLGTMMGLNLRAQTTIDASGIKSLNEIPAHLLQTDADGKKYYYDPNQHIRIYQEGNEKLVIMDELVLAKKPIFNNQLDKNHYLFMNSKLARVYPLFLKALTHYRSVMKEAEGLLGKDRDEYIKKRQNELATQYEDQLKDLTTTEGRVFAKLMSRATGKTVKDIITELRGSWSAFWWTVKGDIADVELDIPYDPHANRDDEFIEHLLQTHWQQGHYTPYEGYLDFKP